MNWNELKADIEKDKRIQLTNDQQKAIIELLANKVTHWRTAELMNKHFPELGDKMTENWAEHFRRKNKKLIATRQEEILTGETL